MKRSNESGSTAVAGIERRRSPRKAHIIEAHVSSPTANPADPPIEAAAVNISRHGVGFETLTPLATGAYFVLEIGFGDQELVTEVKIISCRKTDHGNYAIGAEFH